MLSSCQWERQTDALAHLPADERWLAYVNDGREQYEENKLVEARASFSKAVELARTFAATDKRLMSSLTDMANCYTSEGQYALAIPIYRESLDKAKALNIPDSEPLVYETVLGAATAYSNQQKFGDAGPLFARLKRVAESMPDRNLDLQKLTFALSEFYMSQRSVEAYQSAASLLTRLELIERRLWGKDSPRVGTVLWRQARLLLLQKKYSESVDKFKQFLEIEAKQDHRVQTHMLLNNYTSLLARENRLKEIEEVRSYYAKAPDTAAEKRTTAQKESMLAPEAAWQKYEKEGEQSLKQKNYKEAQATFELAAKLAKESFGAQDKRSLASLYNVAKCDYAAGQYSKCEPTFEALLKAAEQKQIPESDPLFYAVLLSLGNTYSELGKFEKADAVYDRLTGIIEKMSLNLPDLHARSFAPIEYYLSRQTPQSSARALTLLKRLEEANASAKDGRLSGWIAFRQAHALLGMARYEDSVRKFEEFVELDREQLGDLQTRMRIYNYVGRLDKKKRSKEVDKIKKKYAKLLTF